MGRITQFPPGQLRCGGAATRPVLRRSTRRAAPASTAQAPTRPVAQRNRIYMGIS